MESRPHALEYRTAVPARAYRFAIMRDGGVVTVIVPPPPLWRALLVPALVVLPVGLMVLFAMAGVAMALHEQIETGAAAVLVLVAAAGVVFWAHLVWRLVRVARRGGRPTVLTASAHSLVIDSPWLNGDGPRTVPRGHVVDLRAAEAGAVRAVLISMRLRIDLSDGTDVTVTIPWPARQPMAPVQDNLRDALGLKVG